MLVAYKGVDCYLQHYCPKKCLRVRYHGSNVWEKWGNAESEIGLNVNHIKNKKRKKGDKPITDPTTEHLSYTPPTSNVRSNSMRDMGTEMTPIASQEPSRIGTPLRATTPSTRSPINS